MHVTHVPFDQTRSFSDFFLDYIQKNETLAPFYNRFPEIENFKEQILEKQKSFSDHNRSVLYQSIKNQYQATTLSSAVASNIEALTDANTFTVTTGHQLNIFTGPLYFIYKIVTTINTCRQLKARYPELNFVPVYWMASEDHDYDEIKSFRLYGKKYSWDTVQTGAVGRFATSDFQELLAQLPGDTTIFVDAYTQNKTLAEAVRQYVNALFEQEGLIVIDADEASLKALFTNVMEEDIFKGITKKLVDETNVQLKNKGYEAQVFCRDINFFFLDENIRERIEAQAHGFAVVDTELSFTKDELQKIIQKNPEKLSPNVILRPLYQETILPNLAYIGGPSEIVYWLQLKSVFSRFEIPFPVLMPRNFGLVIEQHVIKKFNKTRLELVDLFQDKNYLFNHWVLKNSTHDLSVDKERVAFEALYTAIRNRAKAIDATLEDFVLAEQKRTMNGLEKTVKKMLRAEKRVQHDKLGQIEAVKDLLFPNGSLQERTDNFLNFYQGDAEFINTLMSAFDPFDFRMHVLIGDEE